MRITEHIKASCKSIKHFFNLKLQFVDKKMIKNVYISARKTEMKVKEERMG
jgi:hypothetical protein